MIKIKFGANLEILRSDNEGECLSHRLQNYLLQNGIESQTSSAYTTEQNRVVEHKNKLLLEVTRAL